MEDELKTDTLNIGSKGQHDLRKTIMILYKDNMNTEKLIDFMTRLIADSKKKVFLVLDNLRVHRAKLVQSWVEEHKDRIELFFLPPYSPEYNPDELLNSDIKRNAGAKQSPRSQAELETNVQNRLDFLASAPDIISSFFLAPFTQYAA